MRRKGDKVERREGDKEEEVLGSYFSEEELKHSHLCVRTDKRCVLQSLWPSRKKIHDCNNSLFCTR